MRTAEWTPTERRMLAVLSDGLPHTRGELHACLWDDHAALQAIRFHISCIRRKLAPLGETIVCELHLGTVHYRHVRLLTRPNGVDE